MKSLCALIIEVGEGIDYQLKRAYTCVKKKDWPFKCIKGLAIVKGCLNEANNSPKFFHFSFHIYKNFTVTPLTTKASYALTTLAIYFV